MRCLCVIAIAFLFGAPYANAAEKSEKKEKKNAVPSLQEEIDAKKQEYSKQAPKEMIEAFAQGIEDVRSTGIEKHAVKIGADAPKFTLKDEKGEEVSLDELLKDGPVIVTFFRGSWCPFCMMQLKAYEGIADRLRKQGASIVAITPQTADHSVTTVKDLGLSYPLLTDADNKIAMEYGLAYELPATIIPYYEKLDLPTYNNTEDLKLPLAATYVIDQEGEIRYAFIDADYSKRAEPAELIKAVRKLSGKKKKDAQ